MKKIKKKIEKRKGFCHLNDKKRDRIEALINKGHLQKEIAIILKVDESTISREINKRKKKGGKYDSETAEKKAQVKRSNSKWQGMKIEKYPELKKRIKKELKACRSPDEIAGMLKTALHP